MRDRHIDYKTIVMIDPIGLILNGGKDVIDRHASYAENIQDRFPELRIKLVVVSKSVGPTERIIKERNLTIIPISLTRNNLFAFVSKAARTLDKLGYKPVVLVAGDPWRAGYAAVLIRRLFFRNSKIQVQLHGDITNLSWIKFRPKNLIKLGLSVLPIKFANQIRVMNISQLKSTRNLFRLKEENIILAPIPIPQRNHLGKSGQVTINPKSIGFIGRLEKDRGTRDLVKLIKKLVIVDPDLNLIIVGIGSENSFLRTRLGELIPKERLIFTGNLSQRQLGEIWPKISVLVSLAPSESFGRAIREALWNGVPIWIRETRGSKDLTRIIPNSYWHSLNLKSSPRDLDVQFKTLLQNRGNFDLGTFFEEENKRNLNILVNSWINLATSK